MQNLIYYICKCYLYWVTPIKFGMTLLSSGVFLINTKFYFNINNYHDIGF